MPSTVLVINDALAVSQKESDLRLFSTTYPWRNRLPRSSCIAILIAKSALQITCVGYFRACSEQIELPVARTDK